MFETKVVDNFIPHILCPVKIRSLVNSLQENPKTIPKILSFEQSVVTQCLHPTRNVQTKFKVSRPNGLGCVMIVEWYMTNI